MLIHQAVIMLNLAFQTVESLRTEMDPTANVKHFFTLWRWQNHLTAHTRNISILWCGFSRVLPMEYTHFFDNHYPVGFRILKKGGQLLNPEVYRILFCLESSVFKRNPGFLAQTKKIDTIRHQCLAKSHMLLRLLLSITLPFICVNASSWHRRCLVSSRF